MTQVAGRHGSRWRRLVAQVKARREPCIRCGQPIDLALAHPDPNSHSVDHYPHPLSTHPHLAEDPANLRSAHLRCNQAAQNNPPTAPLGHTSEHW
jgi:5-methylcytosine-specific restriction endonuclease McrA